MNQIVAHLKIKLELEYDGISAVIEQEEDACAVEDLAAEDANLDWREIDGTTFHYEIQFSGTEKDGYHMYFYPNSKNELSLIDVFWKLIDHDVLEPIVREINRYYGQIKDSRSLRINTWKKTTKEEIKKFFGIILYVGLV